MKKNNIFFTFLLAVFVASPLFSQQDYDVTIGPVLPKKKDTPVYYFGIASGIVYEADYNDKKWEYQRLGASLTPEATMPALTDDDDKNKRIYAYTLMLDGQICKFTYSKDKKAMGFHLFAQHVNKQTLASEGEVKEIAFAKVDGSNMLDMFFVPDFMFAHSISPDRKTVALLTYDWGENVIYSFNF